MRNPVAAADSVEVGGQIFRRGTSGTIPTSKVSAKDRRTAEAGLVKLTDRSDGVTVVKVL